MHCPVKTVLSYFIFGLINLMKKIFFMWIKVDLFFIFNFSHSVYISYYNDCTYIFNFPLPLLQHPHLLHGKTMRALRLENI